MNKLRSYTSIWNVEKVLYSINDLKLPFPVTFSQIIWFVLSLITIIIFSDIPPFSFIDGALIKFFVLPVVFTWFMTQKSFDGKKPIGFLKSICSYWLRPKVTYAYKPLRLKKKMISISTVIVRSDDYISN